MPNVFKRRELKYLLDAESLAFMLAVFARRLCADRNGDGEGGYTVYDTYFDSADSTLVRNSLAGGVFKNKLRLRSYNAPPREADALYLEQKMKLDGMGYKRRARVSAAEVAAMLDGSFCCGESQIKNELAYMFRAYGLRPAVMLRYKRLAFFDRGDPSLRVTVDCRVTGAECDDGLRALGAPVRLVPEGSYILEIKTEHALPLWLTRALSDAGAARVKFSKYGRFFLENKRRVLANA